nr:GntR family transcriptional regulator [Oceaniglobus trochenteri]
MARGSASGPLYRQLATAIAELIAEGALEPGAPLPPERDLARITGLSRVTVRRALGDLTEAGKLEVRQGSGTYVALRPPPRGLQPLQQLTSFSEDMRRRGLSTGSIWMARGLHAPTNEEMMSLGLSMSDRVARLARVRLADGRPMSVERASLPMAFLPDPEVVTGSLYEVLQARGVCPVRAVQRITAVNVTPRDAESLGLLPGAAALSVVRVSYLETGRAVELVRSLYRGDAYDVVAELS